MKKFAGRRQFLQMLGYTAGAGGLMLVSSGCSQDSAGDKGSSPPGGGGVADGQPTPPTAAKPRGSNASLTVRGSAVGTWPYTSTLLPLPGQLPDGFTYVCSEDEALDLTVLSRWEDGSAAVLVVAGRISIRSTGEMRTLTLRPAGVVAKAPLTAARISSVVKSLKMEFGGLGVAEVGNLAQPERVWWANSQTLCARYRAAVSGHETLEAVFDVHAFADDLAFVEVVVENSKLVTAAPRPLRPSDAAYSGAVLVVNGQSTGSVSSSGAAEGTHSAFRAWYASTWVNANPGLRCHGDVTSLQAHPLFWRCDQSGADMSRYANDAYVPWGPGRQRGVGMGSGGDDPSIGPLPLWESQFLQTGDPRGAQAVEASALAVLGFNVNYRDRESGLVPDGKSLTGKYQSGWAKNWPVTENSNNAMTWELAHHPAAGLMAFAVRPSPVFIEIAQKIAVWNGTYNCDPDGLHYGWNGPSSGVTDMTGIFGPSSQLRGRAWGFRSLTHATFLSPDASAWRAGGLYWLDQNRRYLGAWKSNAKAKLNVIWNDAPDAPADSDGPSYALAVAMWMSHFLVCEVHRAANVRLLRGTDQVELDALADWLVLQPVRFVNERTDGGWRYAGQYRTPISRSKTAIDSPSTWAEMAAFQFGTSVPSSVAGPWRAGGDGYERTYADLDARFPEPERSGGGNYVSQFWAALVAAVERGVPGSMAAWQTVQTNVTNLSSWRAGFVQDPRWGAAPRNV